MGLCNSQQKKKKKQDKNDKNRNQNSNVIPQSNCRSTNKLNVGESLNVLMDCESSTSLKRLRILHDYFGNPPGSQIVLSKDEIVSVLDDSDPSWILVKKKNIQLAVPSTHLTSNLRVPVLNNEWYFEDVDRIEATRILLSANTMGAFLVRLPKSAENSLCLSYAAENNKIKHRLIAVECDRYYLNNQMSFQSVEKLIEYYKSSGELLGVKLTVYPKKACPSRFSLEVDCWELSRKHIKLVEKVGQGEFGEVWRAVYKDKVEVAVKTLKDNGQKVSLMQEANLMKQLKHKRLVNLLGVVTVGEPVYIVTEYIHHGSLLSYLRRTPSLQLDVLVDFCAQVAEGMMFLESKAFVHRDLAARNVLVDQNLNCKVADFGLAGFQEDFSGNEKKPGTKLAIKWTAPEALSRSIFSTKSDVWSFGILMYEIISLGKTPYEGIEKKEVYVMVCKSEKMAKDPRCPDPLYEIMLLCWELDPDDRPTFESLYETLSNFDKTSRGLYK